MVFVCQLKRDEQYSGSVAGQRSGEMADLPAGSQRLTALAEVGLGRRLR